MVTDSPTQPAVEQQKTNNEKASETPDRFHPADLLSMPSHKSDLPAGISDAPRPVTAPTLPQVILSDASPAPAGKAPSLEGLPQNFDLQNIVLTTPAEDASKHVQPDFYLNHDGQLIKNPNAHTVPGAPITIELEGNNSAKQAEQYADKLQRETIQYMVEMFRHSHPGEQVPEMWQSFLDSHPDSSFPNEGDSQNNNTVTAPELEAYNQGQPAPPDVPSPDIPQTIPDDQPGGGAPSTGPGGGSGSGSSPEGGGGGGGGGAQSNLPNQVTGNGGAPIDGIPTSSGTMANYDGNTSHMSATQNAVVSAAESSLGQAMWGGWGGANAEEGCAASVSQILNNAGAASLHNAADDECTHMQADLMAQGWTITGTPQPGDVWIGRGGASDEHTGIVGLNNTLMDNHSNNGLFSRDGGGMTGEWNNSVFLKPPDTSTNHPIPTNNGNKG